MRQVPGWTRPTSREHAPNVGCWTTADSHNEAGPMALDAGDGAPHDWLMTPTPSELLSRTWFAADMPVDVCERMAAIGDDQRLSQRNDRRPGRRTVPISRSRPERSDRPPPGLPGRRRADDHHGRRGRRVRLVGPPAGLGRDLDRRHPRPDPSCCSSASGWLRRLPPDCDLAAVVHQRVLLAVARRLQATRLQLLDVYRAGHEPW